MSIQKACQFCGREFIGRGLLFCGRACWDASIAKPVRACRFCGKKCVTRAGSFFCNRFCSARFHAPLTDTKIAATKLAKALENGTRIKIACAQCGKERTIYANQKARIKTCSKACSRLFKTGPYRGRYVLSLFRGKPMTVHRKVALQFLAADALVGKEVHHIDRDRRNNSPSNLVVMKKRDHRSLHAAQIKKKMGRDFTAKEILRLFPDSTWLASVKQLALV